MHRLVAAIAKAVRLRNKLYDVHTFIYSQNSLTILYKLFVIGYSTVVIGEYLLLYTNYGR